MKLEDFISQTLTEIVRGVHRAQEDVREYGAEVNPAGYKVPYNQLGSGQKWSSKNSDVSESIEFDVAVTTIEGKETKGGIGVFAGAVNLGSSGRSEAQNSSVSRIKFSVPLVFPRRSGNDA